MKLIYTNDPIPTSITKSIFLAGPTPRTEDVISWRIEAIKILKDLNFDGTVFIPEFEDFNKNDSISSEDRILWEEKCLNLCDCIVFWVPRDLKDLPAFTTNIEFGMWHDSGKIVFGAPKDSPKNSYLRYYCDRYNISNNYELLDTLKSAIKYLGEGAVRNDGEVNVPLYIWRLDQFQSWYLSHKKIGNELRDARVLFTFRPGNKDFVFTSILHVNIFIKHENRYKTNEFVLSRPDISSILIWKKNDPIDSSDIVLIKEFRSPVSNNEGLVKELIGGSSKNSEDMLHVASEEILEETGFNVEPSRLKFHVSRQLAATLSSHKCNLFSLEISSEELEWFKSQKDVYYGLEKDSERTLIDVLKLKDIHKDTSIDWSTIGMIYFIINE